jgi:hypothetical protein
VLHRPIETAAVLGKVNRYFKSLVKNIWNFLPDYELLQPKTVSSYVSIPKMGI